MRRRRGITKARVFADRKLDAGKRQRGNHEQVDNGVAVIDRRARIFQGWQRRYDFFQSHPR